MMMQMDKTNKHTYTSRQTERQRVQDGGSFNIHNSTILFLAMLIAVLGEIILKIDFKSKSYSWRLISNQNHFLVTKSKSLCNKISQR